MVSAVTQPFETYQRRAIVGEVCQFLARIGCESIIAVGDCCIGIENHLPQQFACAAVVGPSTQKAQNPLAGLPEALPVRDRSVGAAVSCDVLDQVADRAAVVEEMMRVSRDAVVIASTWKDETTLLVERTLDQWHRQLTGMPHPWLTNHFDLGLPVKREAVDALRGNGFHFVELACGSLVEWTFLQISILIHDILPVKSVNFADFNCDYNRSWPTDLTITLPSFPRTTVIAALRDPKAAEALVDFAARPPAVSPMAESLAMIDAMITELQQALGEGERRLEEHMQSQTREFELLLQRQAEEIEALREEVNRLAQTQAT